MWFLVPACSPWGGTVRGQGGEDRPSILRGTWDLGPFLKGGRKMGPWAEIQGPGMFLEDWGGAGLGRYCGLEAPAQPAFPMT